jgi:hypothetical protein
MKQVFGGECETMRTGLCCWVERESGAIGSGLEKVVTWSHSRSLGSGGTLTLVQRRCVHEHSWQQQCNQVFLYLGTGIIHNKEPLKLSAESHKHHVVVTSKLERTCFNGMPFPRGIKQATKGSSEGIHI